MFVSDVTKYKYVICEYLRNISDSEVHKVKLVHKLSSYVTVHGRVHTEEAFTYMVYHMA